MDYKDTKTLSMHCRSGSVTITAGFSQGKQPKFPMGEIPMGQHNTVDFLENRKWRSPNLQDSHADDDGITQFFNQSDWEIQLCYHQKLTYFDNIFVPY